MVGINILYMNKIPNSCKECPLTYLDTGDDAYFGSNERKCVIDDSCVDGMVSERAYDCPLIEAIPKSDYETRLKADMVAMLKEISKKIEEEREDCEKLSNSYERFGIKAMAQRSQIVIQQKINALKGEE